MEEIYKPRESYKTRFENAILEESKIFFDDLIHKSKVDPGENKLLVNKYNAQQLKADKAEKRVKSLKIWRGVAITFTVISFLIALFFTYLLIADGFEIVCLTVALGCALIGIILLVVIFAYLNKHIKNSHEDFLKLDKLAQKAKMDCFDQISPLLRTFDWNMPAKVIEKVTPIIKIDPIFDVRKFNFMHEKYGFNELLDQTKSTCGIVSGSLDTNPFLIVTNKKMVMGTKLYSNSITITYQERVTDSDGDTHYETRTQTLTATLSFPCPYYGNETYVVYGNEAAPNLTFSRAPSNYKGDDDKDLEKFVDKKEKKLKKASQKSVKSGNNFTMMANTEFETLFGATNRDNEVEFRLLFTPLAQQGMVDLLSIPDPFGDDFYFYKNKEINIISSKHSQSTDYTGDPSLFFDYDLERLEDYFISYVSNYFRSLYFDLAPILTIPLYQQHKPTEYIYDKDFLSNYTSYEEEALANKLDKMLFAHEETVTDVILKTKLLKKMETSDLVEVDAYSFKTIRKVEYVHKMGRDGKSHAIPVYYDEYIPLTNKGYMKVRSLDVSNEKYVESASEIRKTLKADNSNFAFTRGLFANYVNLDTLEDDKSLDLLFNNIRNKN